MLTNFVPNIRKIIVIQFELSDRGAVTLYQFIMNFEVSSILLCYYSSADWLTHSGIPWQNLK